MSTFEGQVLAQTVAVARQHEIEPAALLAVVEVESAGKSMDGIYPCLLFERHVFYRELKKAGKAAALSNAVNLGLANSSWQPKTQYKDQGSGAKRAALFERAKVIDEECAIRSCSWGVGQTMGFLYAELHFKSAVQMLAYMMAGGVPAQVECMVREIENKKLTAKLNNHQWASFAKVYNGPGYAQNRYDTKMAAAYGRWSKAMLPDKPVVVKPKELPPAPPPKPIINTKTVTTTATTTATTVAAAWAFPWKYVIAGVMLAIMAGVTYYVIRQRAKQKPQTGVLTNIEEG